LLDGNQRREKLVRHLARAEEAVTASELAQRLGVSRQVIVQDVALLRAAGVEVLATPRGYLLMTGGGGSAHTRTFACKHGPEQLVEELYIMVDGGGRVLDVVVEHPVYGELRGMLMLSSRRDVDRFAAKLAAGMAAPLASLTGGVHLHTVQAASQADLQAIEEDLARAGILLTRDPS